MTSPLVYVAGPLFDEGERWWIETIEARIAAHGLSTFLPHRDNPDKTPDNTLEIFRNVRDAIDRAISSSPTSTASPPTTARHGKSATPSASGAR